MEKPLEFIDEIFDVLNSAKKVQSRYEANRDAIEKTEMEQNDLLHFIEFNDYTHNEKLYLYDELKKCRQQRREMKNENEKLEPLYQALKKINFFNRDEDNNFKADLGNAKRDIERIEQTLETRDYYPRIREDLVDGIDGTGNIFDKLVEKYSKKGE